MVYLTPGENLFCCTHIGKKSLLLYSTTEENLFGCIPYRKKNLNLNNYAKIYFSAKSILLINQGPRWSSLVKNIEGEKSRGTITLTSRSISCSRSTAHVCTALFTSFAIYKVTADSGYIYSHCNGTEFLY